MKKIGRQVLFLQTEDGNPRNGEGSFVRLKNDAIMFAYTQYYGKSWYDHATARIAACYSYDEGESWSEPSLLIEKNENALNIMSVSLLRLQNGDIGLMYLQKMSTDNGITCMPMFRFSGDDGVSWSDPICCTDEPGFYVVNNDRLIQLKNGRLIAPLAHHGGAITKLTPGTVRFIYSDDNGRSWTLTGVKIRSPFKDKKECQEPGIFELDDGRLWTYFRTAYGHQYQSFSYDGGESWTAPAPNLHFTSPDSPMLVKRIKNYVFAIFNPIGYNCLNDLVEEWNSPKRTPYVCAISKNGGLSFDSTEKCFADGEMSDFAKNCVLLEDDTSNSYCYPAAIETSNGFLLAYYHSNGSKVCLNCTKISKISFEELEKAIQ